MNIYLFFGIKFNKTVEDKEKTWQKSGKQKNDGLAVLTVFYAV